MPDCPFNPFDSPRDLELDLVILREAKRESMEIFYPLLYRDILSHNSLYCKSLLDLTLTSQGRLFRQAEPPAMPGDIYSCGEV